MTDSYRQRGVEGPASPQITSTVVGGFTRVEAVAHGIRSGLRFLRLIVGGVGLLVTVLLVFPRSHRSRAEGDRRISKGNL